MTDQYALPHPMRFRCPDCGHSLRDLCARLDGNPIWRCYGCHAAWIYGNHGWRRIPAPPVKVRNRLAPAASNPAPQKAPAPEKTRRRTA